jgi:hypothetical protein
MREDVYIEEVISKCEAFKKASLWPSEQILKPRAWLNNFEDSDKYIAAVLLNHFIFYNDQLTNYLFLSSYQSIGDGYSKGPSAPDKNTLLNALKTAIYAPVEGENPNPTDSGYIMCRRARQVLGISENRIVNTSKALMHAAQGGTVVFIDDFIGSGDQFLSTWEKSYPLLGKNSFSSLQPYTNFIAIYVALVSTHTGLEAIQARAPSVAICLTHTLNEDATYKKIGFGTPLQDSIVALLEKYSQLLTPREEYMSNNPAWKAFGFKEKGLLFGFSHSIPDATLPIFWSPGINNWEPLIERL